MTGVRAFARMEYLCLLSCCSCFPRAVDANAGPAPKSVRIVYLVSADRPVREDFRAAIEMAAKDLQVWYGKQLGGATFRLNNPVVETVHSGKEAAWFYSHANGPREDDWGFNNGLAEAHRLVGARHGDPEYVWVIYSDGPGNKGRGGSGVTVLPEDDLLGLIGKHATQKSVQRWIAGLGHELGHAFGLPHPADTEKHGDAIMWAGIYGKYPDKTYLTDEDKAILMKSPFFFHPDGRPVVEPPEEVERYTYNGGQFIKYSSDNDSYWLEAKTDNSAQYRFREKSRDQTWINLYDAGRNMTLRLPAHGGMCEWSVDDGKTWHPIYRVSRLE